MCASILSICSYDIFDCAEHHITFEAYARRASHYQPDYMVYFQHNQNDRINTLVSLFCSILCAIFSSPLPLFLFLSDVSYHFLRTIMLSIHRSTDDEMRCVPCDDALTQGTGGRLVGHSLLILYLGHYENDIRTVSKTIAIWKLIAMWYLYVYR